MQVALDAGSLTVAPMQPQEIAGVAVLMARSCAPGPESQPIADIEHAALLKPCQNSQPAV